MLKLETTYNLMNNIEIMDRTIEGSAILNKFLKGFGMYNHYIESRKIQDGLEAYVNFYIWNEEDLTKKLDKLFGEYDKIYNFIKESEYYKDIPEERQTDMLHEFTLVYTSIKFLLPDIFNKYKVIRENMEEEKKKEQILDNFLKDLKNL